MPLEIQEIDFRLRVDSNEGENASEKEDETESKGMCCGPSEAEREEMVRECVRRVLWTLEAPSRR